MKTFNTPQCGRKVLVIIDSGLLQAVGTSEGTQIWSCTKFSFCSLVSLPLRLGVCHVSEV